LGQIAALPIRRRWVIGEVNRGFGRVVGRVRRWRRVATTFSEVIPQCVVLIFEFRDVVFEIRDLLPEECDFTIEVCDRRVRYTDGLSVCARFGLRVNQRYLRGV
jgi:hypothetical protein